MFRPRATWREMTKPGPEQGVSYGSEGKGGSSFPQQEGNTRMKTLPLLNSTVAGLIATLVAGPMLAEQAPGFFDMAKSEPIYAPGDFKPAPETISTRFGKLEFPGGYPTEETAQKVFDELDLQRATQLYLDMYPALSAHGLMKGWVRDLGMSDSSQISVTADRLDSSALVLTGNTESLYAFVVFDLKKDGPTVFEVPPGVMGPLDDHNFLFVTDIGPTGMDKGQGGKYLYLPPDWEGEEPEGYFTYRSPTYMNIMFWRGFLDDGDPGPAMASARETLKVYPLGREADAAPMEFYNVSGKSYNTIHSNDAHFYSELKAVVDTEPASAFSPEILGLLASIGIEKGKALSPDARLQDILEEAVAVGRDRAA